MSAPTLSPAVVRQRFHASGDSPAEAAHAAHLLKVLLAQDGSTTRLCETIAGGPVSLQVVQQKVVHSIPVEFASVLPGTAFLERITFLAAHGQVMMDNLSYIALDGLPADVLQALEGGATPIGHLLARLWVRRSFLDAAPALHERLWSATGSPDPCASRAYSVSTPQGPCMLIAETYRRGMRLAHGK